MEGKTKPAFIDRAVHDSVCRDDRDWIIEHFEMRLHELMKKGAHHTHPWITERYESDLNHLYKGYRPTSADDLEKCPEK